MGDKCHNLRQNEFINNTQLQSSDKSRKEPKNEMAML